MHKLIACVLGNSYDIIPAMNGEQGLIEARKTHPDLIISDVRMPKIDGFQFREQLRQIPELDLTPFIFLTGLHSDEAKIKGLSMGADDFLLKPIKPAVLLRRVHLLLERSRVYREDSLTRFSNEVNSAFVHQQPPNIMNYDINFITMPAKTGGGDLIDFVKQGELIYNFIFADVMGKGTKAKFFAYSFMGYLRGLLYPMILSEQSVKPSDVLNRLSQLVDIDPFLQDVFITLLLAQFDFNKNSFSYTNAGHMPSYLFNREKQTLSELNHGGGIPAFTSCEYFEGKKHLNPGDFLIVFSDGVTDAKNTQNEMLGLDLTKKWISDHYYLSAKEISEGILDIIQNHSVNTIQYDDISISVLKRIK